MAGNHMAEWNGGDDEEEALRQAIAMSLGASPPHRDSGTGSNNGLEAFVHPTKDIKDTQPSSMFALGLDRKKMEEERLARLKKRKADSSLDSQGRDEVLPPTQRPKLMNANAADKPIVARPAMPASTSSFKSSPYSTKAGPQISKPSTAAHLPYPKGTVLKTWVRGNPRRDDIMIEEVLQKDDLELAVLSSFQWDEDWLMEKLDLRKTKVLMIAYAADEATVSSLPSSFSKILARDFPAPSEVKFGA